MSVLRASASSRALGDDAIEDWYCERFPVTSTSAPIVLTTDVLANRGIIIRNPIANSPTIVYARHSATATDTEGVAISPGEQVFLGLKDPKGIFVKSSSNVDVEVIVT